MLFTNIQLDDFSTTLARLLERLDIEEPEEREPFEFVLSDDATSDILSL